MREVGERLARPCELILKFLLLGGAEGSAADHDLEVRDQMAVHAA